MSDNARDLFARLQREARLLRNLELWNSSRPLRATESWRDAPENDTRQRLEQVSAFAHPATVRPNEPQPAPIGAEETMSSTIDKTAVAGQEEESQQGGAAAAQAAQPAEGAQSAADIARGFVQNCAELCTNSENVHHDGAPAQTQDSAPAPTEHDLTARQKSAINLIVMGRSIGATAKALGVHRNTIFYWRANNPLFAAELARRQREIFDTATNRLRLTLIKSLNVVDRWLDDGETGPKTALRLLAQLNLKNVVAPRDSMDEQQIADDLIRQRRRLAGEDDTVPVTPAERFKLLEEVRKQEEKLGL